MPLHRGRALGDVSGFIARVPADVLVEITPLDPRSGQPAIRHGRQALRRGLHVVTANKGPVALAPENEKLLPGLVACPVAWHFRLTFVTIAAGLVSLHLFAWLI